MATRYLACDLGAESGRVILGTLESRKLTLEEIHRFRNDPIRTNDGSLHWNIPELLTELKDGLRKAAACRVPISSLSCDSWGVDYLLLNKEGALLPPAFHYRDSRAARGVENVYAKIDWPTIFAETGIQFMPFNTLFQLAAEAPERLAMAHRMLLVGDAFNFFLSGVDCTEETLASTSQLYNPETRNWSERLREALQFPDHLFTRIVPAGTLLGPLRRELEVETGLKGVQVVASCSHDTAAAVAAVPALSGHWAYLSSGTWSLIGIELPVPHITETCRQLNFTNEIGFGGSVRVLKNIVGLWIIQECRRYWARIGQEFEYGALTALAAAAPSFQAFINPTDPQFLAPDDMPIKVQAFCRQTNQPVPEGPGPICRCVFESLALLYRRTLKQIEQLTGSRIERLHIVGGGSKNTLLNEFTANALQIPVLTGPSEATAVGNLLVQAISLGHLPSLRDARNVVRESIEIGTVQPQRAGEWKTAYQQFEQWF